MSDPEHPSQDASHEMRITGLTPETFTRVAEFARSLGGMVLSDTFDTQNTLHDPTEATTSAMPDRYLRRDQLVRTIRVPQINSLWGKIQTADEEIAPEKRMIQEGPPERLSVNNTAQFVFDVMTGNIIKPKGLGDTAMHTLINVSYTFAEPHPGILPSESPEISYLEELNNRPALTKEAIEAFAQSLYEKRQNSFGTTQQHMTKLLTKSLAYGWHLNSDGNVGGGVLLWNNPQRPNFNFENSGVTAVTIDRLKAAYDQGPPQNIRSKYTIAALIQALKYKGVTFAEPEPFIGPPVHFSNTAPKHSPKHGGPKASEVFDIFSGLNIVREVNHAADRKLYYPLSEIFSDPSDANPEIIPHKVSELLDALFVQRTATLGQVGMSEDQTRMLLKFMATHRSIDPVLAHITNSRRDVETIDFTAFERLAQALQIPCEIDVLKQKISEHYADQLHFARGDILPLTTAWLLEQHDQLIYNWASKKFLLSLPESYLLARYVPLLKAARMREKFDK